MVLPKCVHCHVIVTQVRSGIFAATKRGLGQPPMQAHGERSGEGEREEKGGRAEEVRSRQRNVRVERDGREGYYGRRKGGSECE